MSVIVQVPSTSSEVKEEVSEAQVLSDSTIESSVTSPPSSSGSASSENRSDLSSYPTSSSNSGHNPPDGGEAKRPKLYLSSPSCSPDRQDMYCSSTIPGDGPGLLADGTGLKDDSPKRLCLVCGDVASGFHYGVASCEACKAFFKRTIQGNIEYTCPASNDCEINKRRRKACQACRFQKCLRMGMLKEGVRLDRVRGGRQKYRRNSESSSGIIVTNYSNPSNNGVPNNLPPTNVTTTQTSKLSAKDHRLLTVLTACEPDTPSVMLDSVVAVTASSPDIRTLSTLSELVDRELVSIISWAKQIPGFTDLTLNDQMRLLQSSWAEILTLSLSYRSLPPSGKLRYAVDFALDEKIAAECKSQEMFAMCLHVIDRLNQLNITREEYLILKAIVLANSDIKAENASSLRKFRESLYSGLVDVIATIRPHNGSSSSTTYHLGELLLCLPVLRQCDQIVRKYWQMVKKEGNIPMHKLFAEMLESHHSR